MIISIKKRLKTVLENIKYKYIIVRINSKLMYLKNRRFCGSTFKSFTEFKVYSINH